MTRSLLVLLGCLGLSACGTGGLEGGVVTYDALNQAQKACAAQGQTLKLKDQGDPQRIDAYACEGK